MATEGEIIVSVQKVSLRSGWDDCQVAKKKVAIEREGIFDSVFQLDLRHEQISNHFQPTKLVYLDGVRGRRGDVKG